MSIPTLSGLNLLFVKIQDLKEEVENNKNDLVGKPALCESFRLKISTLKQQVKSIEDYVWDQNQAVVFKTIQMQVNGIIKKLQKAAPKHFPIEPVCKFTVKKDLRKVIDLFKARQVREALQSFKHFALANPIDAGIIFEILWLIKGSPKINDFGRTAFFNEAGCFSMQIEKIEAINAFLIGITKFNSCELLTESAKQKLNKIISKCNTGFESEALEKFRDFEGLYPKIAHVVFRNVWELSGCPKGHSDFGRIAFYNLDPNSSIKCDFNIKEEAITKVIADLKAFFTDPLFCKEQDSFRRDERSLKVIHETLEILKDGKYVSSSGQMRDVGKNLEYAIEHSRFVDCKGNVEKKLPRFPQSNLQVIGQNCVKVAYNLAFMGYNPCLLNLANSHHFGGCYLTATGSQEEELTRTTGIAAALDLQHGMQKTQFYPIHKHTSPGGGVYSPHVPIIRMGREQDYQFYEEPVSVGVATFAAFDKPELDYSDAKNPRLKSDQLQWTNYKVYNILATAYENGHDSVVLGAFGCGAFANPPQHVAEIMMGVIDRYFKGCFKLITFAVFEDSPHGFKHNPEGNFIPFAREVEKYGGQAFDASGQLTSKNTASGSQKDEI